MTNMTNELVEKETTSTVKTIEEFSKEWADFQEFVRSQLQEGVDYGRVPGVKKPFLMLPGAEKICSRYMVRPEYSIIGKVEDWDKGLFNFEVKCVLRRIATGQIVGEGIGSCNSYEEKYRYVWVRQSEVGNRKVLGQRKSGKYTEYKVEREDLATLHNTILKMAKKRALVDASLTLGNASGMFTQDVEDLPKEVIQAEVEEENIIEEVPPLSKEKSHPQEPSSLQEQVLNLWKQLSLTRWHGEPIEDVAKKANEKKLKAMIDWAKKKLAERELKQHKETQAEKLRKDILELVLSATPTNEELERIGIEDTGISLEDELKRYDYPKLKEIKEKLEKMVAREN